MCTAISHRANHHYFGRNLDLERTYGERVVITPRNYPFKMRCVGTLESHYAIIGMATVVDDYPLYYEATNEKGVSIAGLNFPDNADYKEYEEGKDNITPFELAPWLLSQCACMTEVMALLDKINIVKINFSEKLPLSPLHWIISDKEKSITIECVEHGLRIYDNPFGVLTNNPTFDYHMMNVNNYMGLHEGFAQNTLCPDNILKNYSLGLGAMGLPGDFSSSSRFIRALFVKEKSCIGNTEKESVNQFFHILSSVAMPKGCVMAANGEYEYTRYSSCCNTDKGIYYYTTYDCRSITSIDMNSVDLEACNLYLYNYIE
ncbi:MAG: choloylglycine hydrolase family protein [Lachnospiraceae bacterium]|nr:choloylglycine hydrolase family protein [Lachnospiraceae bacterium]